MHRKLEVLKTSQKGLHQGSLLRKEDNLFQFGRPKGQSKQSASPGMAGRHEAVCGAGGTNVTIDPLVMKHCSICGRKVGMQGQIVNDLETPLMNKYIQKQLLCYFIMMPRIPLNLLTSYRVVEFCLLKNQSTNVIRCYLRKFKGPNCGHPMVKQRSKWDLALGGYLLVFSGPVCGWCFMNFSLQLMLVFLFPFAAASLIFLFQCVSTSGSLYHFRVPK